MKHKEVSENFKRLQEASQSIKKAQHQKIINKQTKYSDSEAKCRLSNKHCQKSRIRETKHLSTNADSSTDAIGGRTKNTTKPNFFEKRKKIIQNARNQKRLEICQNQRYALPPEVSNPSGSVVSGWTKNTQKPDFFEQRKKSSKTQKLKNVQGYAKISDTPFNQRSLIHREAWFPGGPRITQNPIFSKNGKKSSKMQKLKNVQKYAKISDTPFDQRSLIHREAWFPPYFVGQRILQNPIFLKNRKNHPKRRNSNKSRNISKLAIHPLTRAL